MAISCRGLRSTCNTAATSKSKNKNQSDPPRTNASIRLLMLDGGAKTYHRRVYASELMAEFPKHLVCHSDSFCIGQKVPTLSELDELRAGNTYFLLPARFFQSVLSFLTLATSLATSAAAANSKGPPPRCFAVHKTPSGRLQVRVSVDELVEKEEDQLQEGGNDMGVCTTDALAKEYGKLVGSKSFQWKPRLETIRESDGTRGAAVASAILRKVMGWKKGRRHQQRKTLYHHQQ